MKRALLLLLPVLLSGCVASSLDRVVKEMGKDPATAHISVRSIYFTIEVDRTNPTTNTLAHTVKDGMIEVRK